MKRREFIKKCSQATAVALSASMIPTVSCSRRHINTRSVERPNILLLVADNLGWRDLGCCGNADISTPHIDRLANDGIRFSNAFITSSSCSPSRASIITGQYPHTNGVTGLTHIRKRLMLSPFSITLPDVLSDCGYNTALEGKWHVAPYFPAGWYGYRERLSGIMPKDFFIDSSEKALAFIERNRDTPFYLELNYMDTHRDRYGEFHFDEKFPVDPGNITVPDYYVLPDWPEIRMDITKYYSNAAAMDAKIGEILLKLDELGLTERTIVCFVSDNGAQFPGGIMSLYDRGIGTPLILRWPGRIAAGSVSHQLVTTIDIMPTMLEAAGCLIPDSVQGRSVLPLAMGTTSRGGRESIFAEMTYHVDYLPMRAVRTSAWKYIRNYSDDPIGLDQLAHKEWAHRLCELPNHAWLEPRVPEELYDLRTDPYEQENIAANPASRGELESLRRRLDTHMRETDDPYIGKSFEENYEIRDMRRSGEKAYF